MHHELIAEQQCLPACRGRPRSRLWAAAAAAAAAAEAEAEAGAEAVVGRASAGVTEPVATRPELVAAAAEVAAEVEGIGTEEGASKEARWARRVGAVSFLRYNLILGC